VGTTEPCGKSHLPTPKRRDEEFLFFSLSYEDAQDENDWKLRIESRGNQPTQIYLENGH